MWEGGKKGKPGDSCKQGPLQKGKGKKVLFGFGKKWEKEKRVTVLA